MKTSWITSVFPLAMIVQSLAASFIYGLNRDWKNALYFFLGAACTATVAFMKD